MSITELALAVRGQWTHRQQEQCCGLLEEQCPGRMSGCNQRQDLVLIKKLELILDSCTLELTPVDEVWPNLYIGNV